MAVVFRYATRRYLERTVDNVVTCDARDSELSDVNDADQLTASAATYTLYAGSRILVDAVAATGLGPPATYTIPAATLPATEGLSTRLQERWALTIGGVVHTLTRSASLVRFVPRQVITDTDVIAGHTTLRQLLDADEGDFSRQRAEAWVWVVKQLESKGRRPELVLDSSDLREAHIARTRFELFRDYANSTVSDQRYAKLADKYELGAQHSIDTMPLDYDSDGDGFDDDGDATTAAAVIVPNRPPCWG